MTMNKIIAINPLNHFPCLQLSQYVKRNATEHLLQPAAPLCIRISHFWSHFQASISSSVHKLDRKNVSTFNTSQQCLRILLTCFRARVSAAMGKRKVVIFVLPLIKSSNILPRCYSCYGVHVVK